MSGFGGVGHRDVGRRGAPARLAREGPSTAIRTSSINEFGQPVGDPIAGWSPRSRPQPLTLTGRFVRLEPLGPAHAAGLLTNLAAHPALWTYRNDEPPTELAAAATVIAKSRSTHDVAFAAVPAGQDELCGILSIMRTDPANGVTEIGAIMYAPDLQRTPATTEAAHLAAAYLLDDLGYRRLEWKCDSLNQSSRHAAVRLGFTEEGTFRNAVVYKGRSRDTTWFSITDAEWPRIRAAHRRWLDPANFGTDGSQHRSLSDLFA